MFDFFNFSPTIPAVVRIGAWWKEFNRWYIQFFNLLQDGLILRSSKIVYYLWCECRCRSV